ncbi:MAG TPA: MFS transporter [Fimbriimonadaceae bacterium]|jgi:MFS family permease
MQTDRKLALARWSVALVFFLNGALLGGLFPYLPVIKLALHLTDKDLGLSLLFSPIGAVVTMPWVGKFIARFGTRKMTLVTCTILCLAIPCSLAAQSVWLLRLALFAFGCSNGAMDVTMNTEAVMVQHGYSKPILSFTHGCWSLGGFVAAGGISLASRFGDNPVLHAAIANVIICIGVWWASLYFLEHPAKEDVEDHPFALPKGPLFLLGIITMCCFATEGAAYDWSAVYFRVSLKTTESLAALGFGIFVGAAAVARLFGDLVVYRLGNVRSLQIGSIIATLGFLLAVNTSSPVVAAIGFALCGVGVANLVPILFRAAGSVEGIPPGVAISAIGTCGYSAFLLSPPTIGFVADRTSLSFALGCAGALVLVVFVFAKRALSRTGLGEVVGRT